MYISMCHSMVFLEWPHGSSLISLFLWWKVLFPSTQTFSRVPTGSSTFFSVLVHGCLLGPQNFPMYLLTVDWPHWHGTSTIVELISLIGAANVNGTVNLLLNIIRFTIVTCCTNFDEPCQSTCDWHPWCSSSCIPLSIAWSSC